MESNEYIDEGEYLSDDIGRLIEILLRQWRLIVVATLVCAIAAGMVGVLQPKSYRATAMIASKLSTSDVSLGSTIDTSSDEELITSRVIDQKTRMQSYLNLVSSPLIAQLVLDEIKPQYPDEMLTVPGLTGMVEGEIAEGSDSIMIKATSGNPQMSADIANAWAQAYVGQINSIYGSQSDIEGFEAIQEQMERTAGEYQEVQQALENYYATRGVIQIERQVDETLNILDSLYGSREGLIDELIQAKKSELVTLSAARRKIVSNLNAAEDLRRNIEEGGDGAAQSGYLALNLLKANLFSEDVNVIAGRVVAEKELVGIELDSIIQPQYIQPQIIQGSAANLFYQTDSMTVTSEVMLDDLDSLISALESRKERLDENLANISTELLAFSNTSDANSDVVSSLLTETGERDNIEAFETKLQRLKADLETEQSLERELIQQRDLAWESYKNLQIKAAELSVSLGIKKAALVFAAPAVAPRGDTSSTAKNVLIAAVVGFMFGVSAAFATEFWWRYKDIEPYPLLTRRKRTQASQ